MASVRWGLLSTAAIGALVVRATRGSDLTRFVAVASRDGDRARDFALAEDIEASFPSYEAMLGSDDVDAVYVALPVSLHTEWTVKALEAGKHVLCEKPFAMTAAAITAGDTLPFGRADAVARARVLEALRESSLLDQPVTSLEERHR